MENVAFFLIISSIVGPILALKWYLGGWEKEAVSDTRVVIISMVSFISGIYTGRSTGRRR